MGAGGQQCGWSARPALELGCEFFFGVAGHHPSSKRSSLDTCIESEKPNKHRWLLVSYLYLYRLLDSLGLAWLRFRAFVRIGAVEHAGATKFEYRSRPGARSAHENRCGTS